MPQCRASASPRCWRGVSAVRTLSHSFATQALLAHGAMCRGEVIDEIVDPRGALRLLLIDLRHWAMKEKIDYSKIDSDAELTYIQEVVKESSS
jgi:hypothetical protein